MAQRLEVGKRAPQTLIVASGITVTGAATISCLVIGRTRDEVAGAASKTV